MIFNNDSVYSYGLLILVLTHKISVIYGIGQCTCMLNILDTIVSMMATLMRSMFVVWKSYLAISSASTYWVHLLENTAYRALPNLLVEDLASIVLIH